MMHRAMDRLRPRLSPAHLVLSPGMARCYPAVLLWGFHIHPEAVVMEARRSLALAITAETNREFVLPGMSAIFFNLLWFSSYTRSI